MDRQADGYLTELSRQGYGSPFVLTTMATRGVITLVFDDGYEGVYTDVVPLLRRWQIPAVFAVPLDAQAVSRTEARPTVPWQQWQSIVSEGHELAAHGITHRSFTRLSSEELERELRVPAATLSATTLVYPGGGTSAAVKSAVGAHYKAARGTQYGFELLPPRDPFGLHTVNYTRHNFSLARANWRALWACATNRWLIETYHLVDDNEREAVHSVSLSELTRHLDFMRRLPIRFATIKQIVPGI